MPIYEYECSECGANIEAVQKISDSPLTECRNCGGMLKKLISQTTFHLKGGGWFADTYGKSSNTSGTTTKSETSSSSKPADKTPSKENV